jgi:hypothetical protein
LRLSPSLRLASRAWVYLRRGYAQFAFLVSIANFLVIQYRLLVGPTLLRGDFPGLWLWALGVILAGLPIAILLGRWDYKRFTAPTEMEIAAKVNPLTGDTIEAWLALLDTLARQTGDPALRERLLEARRRLEKWAHPTSTHH